MKESYDVVVAVPAENGLPLTTKLIVPPVKVAEG